VQRIHSLTVVLFKRIDTCLLINNTGIQLQFEMIVSLMISSNVTYYYK